MCKYTLPSSSFPLSESLRIKTRTSFMLTKDCTEMHLLPFYICISVWWFCFIFSVYVSTDAYCGPRTTSEVSIYLPPCFEAVSFCCSSAVYFRLVSPQDPRNFPVSNSHPGCVGTGIIDIHYCVQLLHVF